uniref:Biorientation of chromosomes in cell division protein 1-like 1 n=1 Tax=Sphenodon punctatus TaxID=8508 RepID=A0A8D0H9T9_SPHPU
MQAREKEERLLRRQINREKLEEKRKQKAAEKTKSLKTGSQGKTVINLEEYSPKFPELKATGNSIKDVLKEQKFFEKKVALSRKRKRDSRHVEDSWKKKYEQTEDDSKEIQKANETCEKSSLKDLKHNQGKSEASKPVRRLSESVQSTDENKSDPKAEREHKRKTSTSLQTEGVQQDIDTKDPKNQLERSENNTEEAQKQKNVLKNEKHIKKEDTETQNFKSIPKKESKIPREKNEKERTLLEDKLSVKHKYKGDSVHKTGDEGEPLPSERGSKGDDSVQKHNQQTKVSLDDKSERKSKHKSERKVSTSSKDGKNLSECIFKNEENLRKENNKKERHFSTEKSRVEYKSKRSSDSRLPKDSQSTSKLHVSAAPKRTESYSEEKHEVESTNSDSNSRPEESSHKERRRSKSLLEDKFLLKSRSKSHNKQAKAIETALQEYFSKPETGQKPDKESSVDSQLESVVHSIYSLQKDASHRVKLHSGEKIFVKEKYKSDNKDLGSSRHERKLSAEGYKSKSLKHNNKEMKKKEEEKGIKEIQSHEKVQGIDLIMDKKSGRRLACESRKESLSEMPTGEEKISADVFGTSHVPALKRSIRISEDSSHSEQGQEPMEIDSEQTYAEVSKVEERRSSNLLPETGLENIAKDQAYHHNPKKELGNRIDECKASALVFSFIADGSAERTLEHENIFTKEADVSNTSKQASEDPGPIQQGAYQMNIVYETKGRILLNAPTKEPAKSEHQKMTGDARSTKIFKKIVSPIEESSSLVIDSSSKESVVHKTPMDIYLSEFTDSSVDVSKEDSHNSDKATVHKDTTNLDNKPAHAACLEQHGSAVLSCNMKKNEATMIDLVEGEASTFSKQANASALLGIQDDSVQGRGECNFTGVLESESLMPDTAGHHGNVSTKENALMDFENKKRDSLSAGPTAKEKKSAMADNKKEEHETAVVTESSKPLPVTITGVPEERKKSSVLACKGEDEDSMVVDTENKNERNVVGTSGGRGEYTALRKIETTNIVVIGTTTQQMIESTLLTTSSEEGTAEGCTVNSEKEGDATTTCLEEESEVTAIYAGIEADEGFTTGQWTKNNGVCFTTEGDVGECTVEAAEEGGGVTEGFAASESLLTSTKEEESGECTMNYVEDGGKDSASEGIEHENNVNSAATEEKDDAVTSAGSEERHNTSSCRDAGRFEGAVTWIGEVESDGAVTSAGNEGADESMISENSNEFQSNMMRTSQIKEPEGTVTCTGADEKGGGFIICSVTSENAQQESTVTGACVEMVDNNVMSGTSADKGEDTVNSESAVTSTGITSEDEGAAVCPGMEDSNEGFAMCLEAEEKYESAMDSTGAKVETNTSRRSVGPCDDEGFVTSTGAKEEDEEGEDFVTSTGRGNEEIEHAPTCTGTEEAESALVSIGAEEGESSIICTAARRKEAESGVGVSDVNKGVVDSMTSIEKESQGNRICSSAKGVVESSVTSASTGVESTLVPVTQKNEDAMISIVAEEYEGPMTSVFTEKDKGQLTAVVEKAEDSMISIGNRECDGLITSAVTKELESSLTSAGEEEETRGDTISTSTVEEGEASVSHSAIRVEQSPLPVARTGENRSTIILIAMEECDAPMPSTAADYKSPYAASHKQEKDECTIISTSIMEEFEAPMPSAATEERDSRFATVTEDVQGNTMVSTDVEIYEVPMSSASKGDNDEESHPAASGKEEKDVCTVISTSIMEEQETPLPSAATNDTGQHSALEPEGRAETAAISTSTVECSEVSVYSAVDDGQLSASGMEGRLEVALISTSMAGECERVFISAAMETESKRLAAETDVKDENSTVSTNTAKEYKVAPTSVATEEQFELATGRTDENHKESMLFAGTVEECEAPVLSVASTNENQHIASGTEDKEEEAVISESRVEECDSVYTFAVLEESQLATARTEVKDESDVLEGTKETEYILSTDPEKSDDYLTVVSGKDTKNVLCEEQAKQDGVVMKESIVANDTASVDVAETENIMKYMSVNEAICIEINMDSAVNVSPSTEMGAPSETAEQDVSCSEAVTELPCILAEETTEDDSLIDYQATTSTVSETDFSETRTPLPSTHTLIVSEFGSKLTADAKPDEVAVETKLGDECDLRDTDGSKTTIDLGGLGTDVSLQENISINSGEKGTVPTANEELELMTNLKNGEVQESENPTKEELHEKPSAEEYPNDLQLKNAALEKKATDEDPTDTETIEEHITVEEHICQPPVATSKEIAQEASDNMGITDAVEIQTPEIKDQEIEIPAQEEENCMLEMRAEHSATEEGKSDDDQVTQDLREEDERSQCFKAEPVVVKEMNSGDSEGVSKEIIKTRESLSSAVQEKDECPRKLEICETPKQSLESSVNPLEENQPIIVKRKRGRPRKYPVEAIQQKSSPDSKADGSIVNIQQSSALADKEKIPQTAQDASNKKETAN